MLMKQTKVFTLTLSIRILVNTNQKDDFRRPRTCSRNGAYRNANEQYTLDLRVVDCLTETGTTRSVHS